MDKRLRENILRASASPVPEEKYFGRLLGESCPGIDEASVAIPGRQFIEMGVLKKTEFAIEIVRRESRVPVLGTVCGIVRVLTVMFPHEEDHIKASRDQDDKSLRITYYTEFGKKGKIRSTASVHVNGEPDAADSIKSLLAPKKPSSTDFLGSERAAYLFLKDDRLVELISELWGVTRGGLFDRSQEGRIRKEINERLDKQAK